MTAIYDKKTDDEITELFCEICSKVQKIKVEESWLFTNIRCIECGDIIKVI